MRMSDVDILIVPGWSDSGVDHWQSRWERGMKTARRVKQADWFRPDRDNWVRRVIDDAATATRPVVLVGHSLGVATILHAADRVGRGRVAGAFLVAPSDLDALDQWPTPDGQDWRALVGSFAPMPSRALPFPTKVIASSTDPFCTVERAQALASAWGADLSVVAEGGHLNSDSGHGPWPEGLLTFGGFLKGLTLPN